MKLLLTFFILMISGFIYSQDIITLKSGEKLEVKVVEQTNETVKYKKFNNLEGPVYVIEKSEINLITYENGSTENFNSKSGKKEESKDKEKEKDNAKQSDDIEFEQLKEKSISYNSNRHLIGFNYANMIILNMEFSYEAIILKNGFLGLKFPISVGMNLNNRYLRRNNLFSTGLQVNIYPLGQGRAAYLTGPIVRYSYMKDNPNHYNSPSVSTDASHYLGFYMNNGVLFQATSFLNFSLGMALGSRWDVARDNMPATFDVIFDGSIIFRL